MSVAGSLNGDGGRFNVGGALSPGAFTPFPALYVAEDYGTAFRERFGLSSNSKQGSLSTEELALRRPGSFVQVRLRGALEQVIDVGNRQPPDIDLEREVSSSLSLFFRHLVQFFQRLRESGDALAGEKNSPARGTLHLLITLSKNTHCIE